MNFVTVKGAFANTGYIDENGNYKISSPEGEVMIGVDNHMLQVQTPQGKGGGGEKTVRQKKRDEAQKDQPKKGGVLKGRYVPIPSSYADPTTSGLKYTVKPGLQTHDIELSEK